MNQLRIHYSIHQGSIHPGLHLGGSPGGVPSGTVMCGSDDLKFPDQSIKLWSNFFGEVHHGGQQR